MGDKENALDGSPPRADDADPSRCEFLLAEYVERLNAGEALNVAAIRKDHPEVAQDLIDQLRLFQETFQASATPPVLGSLGDYTLRREIGRGGMGVVYDAWQNSMDRRVALKVLPPGIAADRHACARFMREAQTAGHLSHPNVVPIYAMGVDGNTPYYAMEYIEGETLAQILERLTDAKPESVTPFGKKDDVAYFGNLARAFGDVAVGLEHAHSKGVIHRDIKPSNLILDTEGHLRVLDFGLAHLEGQESLTLSGDVVGTPLYMSPEQARRRKIRIDHRTDVYSLGVTLYEMLTLRPPFRGKDHSDTLSQIIEKDPQPPRKLNPRIPRELETIVLKCLRKDAGDRYGTAGALAQDLERFARGDPIEARAQSTWERWGRRVWRNRRKAVVALVITILLLTTALLSYRNYSTALQETRAEYDARVLDAVVGLQLGGVSMDPEGSGPLRIRTAGQLYGFDDFQSRLREARLDPVSRAVDELALTAADIPELPDAYFHRARGLVFLGRAEEALEEFRRALGCDPGFAPARILHDALLAETAREEQLDDSSREDVPREDWVRTWRRAHQATKAQNWEAAAAAYGELIAITKAEGEPYTGLSIESHVGRGLALLEMKSLRAIEDLAVVRNLRPEGVEPDLLLAKAYCAIGDTEVADEIFESLYERAEDERGDVALWVTVIYRSFWEYEKAAKWVERIEMDSIRESMKAVILYNLYRNEEALAAANKAVELSPEDPRGYRARALVYGVGRRDYDSALRSLDEALEIDEKDLGSLIWKGFFLFKKRDYERAESWLLKAEEVDPKNGAVLWVLAMCLFETGRIEEAFEQFDQATALEPYDPELRNSLANCLLRIGKPGEAAAVYKHAVGLVPTLSYPHFNLGQVYWKRGRFNQALAAYRACVEGYPRLPVHHGVFGESLEEEGQLTEAFSQYLEAFELDPTHEGVHETFCRLFRRKEIAAALADGLGRWLEALGEVEEPLDEHPYILNLKALALLRSSGANDEAFECARRAVDKTIDKKNPEILATLAEVQRLEGNGAQAILILEEAVGLPGALHVHADLLEEYREGIGELPSYGSIDWALERLADDADAAETLRKRLRAAAGGEDAASLRAYLDGRLLQLAEEHEAATRKFEAIARDDNTRRQPFFRLIESLREWGRDQEVEKSLRKVLESDATPDRQLWNLWLAVSFVDLGLSPGEASERLNRLIEAMARSEPSDEEDKAEFSGGYTADLIWWLDRLQSDQELRLNCGGGDYTDSKEITWAADRFYTMGRTAPFFVGEVEGTQDAPLYHTSRAFSNKHHGTAAYRIPLPPGTYEVALHFVEWWYQAPGLRRFQVLLEDNEVLSDYDIYASAGFATVHRKTFALQVEDGILDIEFRPRIPISGQLLVGVRQRRGPWISALEVRRSE